MNCPDELVAPEVSVIVVNHKSASYAVRCVESLRSCFAGEGISGEILLVDCASGQEERSRLAGAPSDLTLFLAENRGYSGGLNAGLARARGANLILSNADVVYLPGSLPALLRAVETPSVGAAAPIAFWDAGGRVRLPPGFAPGFFRDLAQLTAGRWLALETRRFASLARETLRLWEQGGFARHLSGAVLAVRREVFDRVGRFDERFLFEYEETEWEDRLRAEGFRLLLVGEARVRHFWGASATASPDTARRRGVSRALYRERCYGPLGRRVLEALAAAEPHPCRARRLEPPAFPRRVGACLAISPNPSLLPFAGASLAEDFSLPEEIVSDLPAGPLYFRVFREADGRPLETFVWEKRTHPPGTCDNSEKIVNSVQLL